jgi:serine/threonine protein kinase
MEVACPQCSTRVRLTPADLASRERLKAFRCEGCGTGFDARLQLAHAPGPAATDDEPDAPPAPTLSKPKREERSSRESVRTVSKNAGTSARKAGTAANATAGSSLLKNIPATIGQYQVLEEINRGGMGIVYKAFDPVLKRKVAIKVLLAGEGATETDIKRFQREAEATARLQHPNIVPIYGIGEYDGKPYFVMDFIEGKTAKQLMEHGEMTPRLALKIIEGVAEALHHAHLHGVIHRDVKPANIIVNQDERPQLMDFGLARRADEDLEITQSGTTMGTPSFMSPEQAEGKLTEVDERSDVYSAGACLYELITGRVPFEAATTMAVLRKIIEEPPVPPRKRHPAINRDVETICLKCLEKKKVQRYQSAQALVEDIRRFNAGEAILAKPAGPFSALWRRLRRHKELSLAALVMVLSGFGVIVYALNESRAAADKVRGERVKRYRDLMTSADESFEQAQRAFQNAERTPDAELFSRAIAQTREALAKAEDAFQGAQALEPERPEAKAGHAQVLKLETQTDVRRFIFKAHSFLHPQPASPGADPPEPNYGGAEFAAQEAVDRDPQNTEARALLREALGMRKVRIALDETPVKGVAPCEVFARRAMDVQFRELKAQTGELGISLGTAPVRDAELEPGFYIVTFQRKGAAKQQAPLHVTREASEGELTLSFPPPGKEENMALTPPGDAHFRDAPTVRVPSFYIDRYEFPNRPGAEPLVGVSLIEAQKHCASQGKQLCSSAQWSRACGGDTGQLFPYGAQYASGACATGFDGAAQTHPFFSGQFPRCRTGAGVYDMVGNAAEWVEAAHETVMGGDWTASNQSPDLSGSCRTAQSADIAKTDHSGFRCCKSP